MDDSRFLEGLRHSLRTEIGDAPYEAWFAHSARFERSGEALRVFAPNRFAQDFLARSYRAAIERAALHASTTRLRVEFAVDAELGHAAHEAAVEPALPEREAPATATPLVPRRPDYSLASLVVGENNRLAVTAAHLAVDRPGSVTPLVVYGPTSVGKTHLLRGVLSAALSSGRVRRGVYVTAEQFTSAFVEALRGGGLPNFRQKFRDVEILALDDAQFFLGKRHTATELLNTLTALERRQAQVVIAADRSPADLAELGPELATRLQGGMICPMAAPPRAARREIVARMASGQGLELDDETLDLLADRFARHVRQLSGAVHRLYAAGQARGAAWTRAAVEAELADLLDCEDRCVRLPDVERAVCAAFGLDRQSLQKAEKAAAINGARQLAMWLARRHTRAGLAEIGRYFGGRSHSTVVSAQKRVDELRQKRTALHINGRRWNVDEALSEVADRLRAVS